MGPSTFASTLEMRPGCALAFAPQPLRVYAHPRGGMPFDEARRLSVAAGVRYFA